MSVLVISKLDQVKKENPWSETRIFIEMDSTYRNQQGNCDEVENSARPYLLYF